MPAETKCTANFRLSSHCWDESIKYMLLDKRLPWFWTTEVLFCFCQRKTVFNLRDRKHVDLLKNRSKVFDLFCNTCKCNYFFFNLKKQTKQTKTFVMLQNQSSVPPYKQKQNKRVIHMFLQCFGLRVLIVGH